MASIQRGPRRSRRAVPAFLVLVLLAAGAVAPSLQRAYAGPAPTAAPEVCPAPATSVPAPAVAWAAQPPPGEIVVCVARTPVTGAAFAHWSIVASKSEGPVSKHGASAQEVAKEVLGFLISSYWVFEEARIRHVHVSASSVRRAFEHLRAQQFPHRGELGKFLEQSGETAEDLLFRVKLNLLSAALQRRIVAGHHDARSISRALARFVSGFKGRWKSRTYCAPEYAVADCGHVVRPPL